MQQSRRRQRLALLCMNTVFTLRETVALSTMETVYLSVLLFWPKYRSGHPEDNLFLLSWTHIFCIQTFYLILKTEALVSISPSEWEEGHVAAQVVGTSEVFFKINLIYFRIL